MISHNSTLLSDNKYTHFMSLFSLWCVWVFYNKNIKVLFIYAHLCVCISVNMPHACGYELRPEKGAGTPHRELHCVCRSWWLNLGLLEEPSALFLATDTRWPATSLSHSPALPTVTDCALTLGARETLPLLCRFLLTDWAQEKSKFNSKNILTSKHLWALSLLGTEEICWFFYI